MALDVYILRSSEPPKAPWPDRALWFEERDLVFLAPHLQDLELGTGRSITPYDDAAFAAGELDLLRAVVRDARARIAGKPERWQEHAGTELAPVRRELYVELVKRDVLAKLDAFERAIDACAARGGVLHFIGD